MIETLVDSARVYYDYLETHGLGVEIIRTKSFHFEGQRLYIFLAQKLFSTDSLLLRCGGREFYVGDEDEIVLISYDEQKHILLLEFMIPTDLFKEFELLSDLKFLVKNVEHFFANANLTFPSQIPYKLCEQDIPLDRLSHDQARALRSIFSSPLSYVWGAPGSGKTQRVLFESLLFLIKQNKKVALIAPTNNALELALKTVIKKSDELGLERSLFLRLGVPSAEFLTLYPESCDSSALDKKQLSLFSLGTPKERMEQACVIAMTLDGFIKRYEGLKIKFDHIFLDECGFAPLIKVCALCANPSPLSMLGDHKQLMPVCEMPQKELEKHPRAKLWNLSALFLESFFELQEGIFEQKQLRLKQTKTAILKETFRYGDNLARLLDEFVYQNGLKGRAIESEVYYLDCSSLSLESLRGEVDSRHISPKEIQGIKTILSSMSGSYAIITPFVKQRQALIYNGVPYDRVFTIHGSQGQEFDDVIFSPVTLHYHLSDSSNPLALQALNVAISRVKKRLIVVCDVGFWQNRPDQFLSRILAIAKRWER
ncbi:AAA domain-containing protein [Helicobacter pametensis]|uniref:AAA domain-containing protein n=1 Tax=Helicobacter pametensis TaxID=95149 RepID=UPI0004B31FEC|nr:AAA domain-containing protein [Helicobacter pametensis]